MNKWILTGLLVSMTACASVDKVAEKGSGPTRKTADAGTSSMTCAVSYGAQEFSINIESENNKIVYMTAFDEAKRTVSFSGASITETSGKGQDPVSALLQPQNYTLRGSAGNDTVSLVISAQNPLSSEFTAYAVAYSDALKVRIPIANPVKVMCRKY